MSREIVLNSLMRQMELELARSGFEDSVETSWKYVNPRRHRMGTKGAKRKTKMYDGVAQDAFWTWVDGMRGWAISDSLNWQRAAIADRRFRDRDAVQRYLDEYTEQMSWEFGEGNFYDAIPEQIQDGGSGGTAVMLTEESRDMSKCVHRVPHPADYWVAENDEGEVDVYHELITMTARKAIQKFGKPGDTLHPMIRTWAKDPKMSLWECDFLTCICPADDSAIYERNVTVGRKPWAVATILYAVRSGEGNNTTYQQELDKSPSDRLIRLQGMDYFPATVWRFRRNSDEQYGFSPAMDVMTAIEAAQQLAMNLLDMANFAARPMMAVPEEGRKGFSRLPGSTFDYISPDRLPKAIEYSREYPVGVDREDKIHDLIRSRYGYHVWNMMRVYQQKRERIQATDIIEGRADQARLLVGQMDNFWRGGAKPTYNNVARIAARAGRLPPAPNELQEVMGRDLVIPTFVGPLRQLQILTTKLSGLQSGLDLLGRIAEIVGRHIGPEEAAKIYARVKLPDLAEYVCDHSGFPQSLMNDDETTAAIIQAREQRAAALQEAKVAQSLAAASGQLGKEPGANSLLQRAVA